MYIPPIENHFAGFVQLTEADSSESIYVEKNSWKCFGGFLAIILASSVCTTCNYKSGENQFGSKVSIK
jgi:hypothetical protein